MTRPTPDPASAYGKLEGRAANVRAIDNALGILHWDQEVQMPAGAGSVRGESLAALTGLRHDALADPAVGDWLDEAEARAADLGDWQRANLREIRRQWAMATSVPADLLTAQVRATSRCELTWREVRPNSDFAGLQPDLARVLTLQRQIGQARAEALGTDVYDALMDEWELGLRAATMAPILDDLADFLPDFLDKVRGYQASHPAPVAPIGLFPADAQAALGERLVRQLGFDPGRGRIDVSAHPFTGGCDDDVRLTTRYDEADFSSSLMGVLHEGGHALYEQGRPRDWLDQPVGASCGLGVHESQSLFIEMQMARGRSFQVFAAPLFRTAFGDNGHAWEPDNLYRLNTRVAPGFIRVDADEVTYPAHIILRFRLEQRLITGELDLVDLPAAWAAEMEALLGIVPPDDRRGCLQDIHWMVGAWGYFPTYTLGAIMAAQLMAAARRALPDLDNRIERGDFVPLIAWLRERVHGRGSLHRAQDLLEAAIGERLDPAAYKAHLRQRYREDA